MPIRVEQVMGTAIGLDLRDEHVASEAVESVFAHLRSVDARFSPYRPDSEVSRLIRGDLEESACSADLRFVLAVCDHLEVTSGGAFDARHAGRLGGLDPSGFVKGWAVEEAAWRLDSAGGRNYLLNAGGDLVSRGEAAPGRPWRIGIRHPDERDRVVKVLEVRDRAIATSGTYERGLHITDPRSGRRSNGLRSLTVVGPGLAFVDAYATSGFVMGMEGLSWVVEHPDHEALAITLDDRVVWTAGMDRYLASGTGPVAVFA